MIRPSDPNLEPTPLERLDLRGTADCFRAVMVLS